jgi:hypothetical protein
MTSNSLQYGVRYNIDAGYEADSRISQFRLDLGTKPGRRFQEASAANEP